MKKLFSLFVLLLFLASPVLASVGVNVNGTTVGTATDMYVSCPSGGNPFINGSAYSAICSSTLVADGTYNGGAVSLGTIDTGITLTNALVRKAISSVAAGATTTDALANGTPNQILTIFITSVVNSGTWTVTPATATGWASIQFNAAKQLVTLLYVDTTIGWIILSNTSSASTAAATINIP